LVESTDPVPDARGILAVVAPGRIGSVLLARVIIRLPAALSRRKPGDPLEILDVLDASFGYLPVLGTAIADRKDVTLFGEASQGATDDFTLWHGDDAPTACGPGQLNVTHRAVDQMD
jgi:hypothetical protein